MELPLQSPAMTLFFCQILVFCSEVVYTLVPDADQVAKNLKVSHFDCGAMTENTLCSQPGPTMPHYTGGIRN